MANVLTDLAADLYKAAGIVAREQVGFIPAVTINAGSERVAFGDTIRSFNTRKPTLNTAYNPSMTIPEGDDQTIDNKTMTIDKVANVKIPWTGEDIKHVNNGSGFTSVYGDQLAQAMRTITNKVEADIGVALKTGSRAYGTAGTTPFATNFNELAEIRKILVDNGTPMDGQVSQVLNSAAGTKLRNLAQLQKVNESGGSQLLRQGVLLDLQGLMLRESAGVASHTKGTGTGYLTNGALAVGATAIPVDTGTGTLLAGDVIAFAADTANKYVVESYAGGVVTIGAPGLLVAIPDNNAITIGNNYTANMAFHRNAVELAIRPPEQPFGGDAAVDRMTIQDPYSGLVYEVAVYKGYGKAMIDITSFYGVKVWKPEFVATLLG